MVAAAAQQRPALLKLYYLGGLDTLKDGSENVEKVRFVSSRGTAFALPEVGGYLEVTEFTARDLIKRHQVATRSGTYAAFTTNRKLAEQVQAGKGKPLGQAKLTRDELLQMLEEMDEVEAADSDNEPVLPNIPSPEDAPVQVIRRAPARKRK